MTDFSTLSPEPRRASLTANSEVKVAAHNVNKFSITQSVEEILYKVLDKRRSDIPLFSTDMANPEKAKPASTALEVEMAFNAAA